MPRTFHTPGGSPLIRRYARPAALHTLSILAVLSSLGALAAALSGCGGSPSPSAQPKVYAPEDMPDICQDIDFNQAGTDLKEACGVQTRNYRAYKNIPEHRNLLLPKGAKIVRKGKGLELRLQSTLPIALPSDLEGKLLFDEKLRRTFIKSRMDYCEFFPENSTERLRLIKMDIPLDIGGERSVCYTVEARPTTAQRKAGYAGRLEPLDCADFARLKAVSKELGNGNGVMEQPMPDPGAPIKNEGGKPEGK
jgi:hypothetical protein